MRKNYIGTPERRWSACLRQARSVGYLVYLVHLVSLMQPNKPDRPNELDKLADFFSILLEEWTGSAIRYFRPPISWLKLSIALPNQDPLRATPRSLLVGCFGLDESSLAR